MFNLTVYSDSFGNTEITKKSVQDMKAQYQPYTETMKGYSFEVKAVEIPESLVLMVAFGWSGGTIHQVQQETGLSIQEIQSLSTVKPLPSKLDGMSDYYMGLHFGHIKSSCYNDKLQYYRGVCEHVFNDRRDALLKILLIN